MNKENKKDSGYWPDSGSFSMSPPSIGRPYRIWAKIKRCVSAFRILLKIKNKEEKNGNSEHIKS